MSRWVDSGPCGRTYLPVVVRAQLPFGPLAAGKGVCGKVFDGSRVAAQTAYVALNQPLIWATYAQQA
jgi:hypothetical protein